MTLKGGKKMKKDINIPKDEIVWKILIPCIVSALTTIVIRLWL